MTECRRRQPSPTRSAPWSGQRSDSRHEPTCPATRGPNAPAMTNAAPTVCDDIAILVIGCAAWMNRDLQRVTEFLDAQLRAVLAAVPRVPRLDREARRRLAELANRIERARLEACARIVTVDTLRRWFRSLVARKWTVGLRDEFEQDAGFGLILADVAEIIEDQAVVAVELRQALGQLQIATGCLEVLDQIGGAAEQDGVAAVDQGMAEGGGEVGLADAAGAEQQDVAAAAEPAVTAGERVEPWPVQAGREGDIEAGDGLARRQPRGLTPGCDATLVALGDFVFEQRLEQALMAPLRLGRTVAEILPQPAHGGQA